jgi:hypothetical protein
MAACENLFVIYPPALGGNHLANLLSLGKKFAKRFDLDSYEQNVSQAHFSNIREIDLDQIRTNLDQLKTQSNVLNGHYLEYLKFRESDLYQHFPSKQFLAIQMPDPGTFAFERMTRGNPTAYTTYLLREVTSLYKMDNLRMLCHETDRPWYSVPTNLLFDPDVNKLFENLAQQGLEIDIDMDLIQDLHSKWYSRL